jgi:hypothetical protein
MNSGKKITPAMTLGIVVVNKGNNKIINHRTIFQRGFCLSLWKIARWLGILLLPLFTTTMPSVTAGVFFFPEFIAT